MDALPFLAITVIILAVFGTAAWASFRAAPFVPLRIRDVRRMLKLLDVKAGDIVCDLGCGDGRMLLEAVKINGVRAIGYEVSLLPYVIARIRVALSPHRDTMTIRFRDFFRENIRTPNVFVCFLTPMAMRKLAPKFAREAAPGSRIASYAFPLPGWSAVVEDKPAPNLGRIYVYRVERPPVD